MTGHVRPLATALRAVLAAALLLPGSALAEASTIAGADLYVRLNPRGVALTASLARRWDRADGDSPLEQGRHLKVGALVSAIPDSASVGVAAEWVPVAALQVGGGYQATAYLGQYGSLLRFDSPDAPFGDAVLQSRRGEEHTGIGHRLYLSPVLRARLGRLILRNETTASWYLMPGPGWTYESTNDTLVASNDWVLQDRASLLVEASRGPGGAVLLLGAAYEVTRAVRAGLVRQRVAGVAFWQPPESWLGFRPSLLVMAGVNLQDRNRGGEPFALVGLGGEWTIGRRP
jgi:hypothetical protein